MKIFSLLLISFLNIGFSQTLVFFNNQDTITFKKNELIKINGQKYLYQKAIKNQTQIHLIESGLFKKEHITLETSKIETFRKYERFRISNSLKTGFHWTCIQVFQLAVYMDFYIVLMVDVVNSQPV